MAAVQSRSVAGKLSHKKRQSNLSKRSVCPSGASSSHTVIVCCKHHLAFLLGVDSPDFRMVQQDPYYGHEETAKLCARFITHLFACPDLPPRSTAIPPAPSPPLAKFIAYALHRTRLHASVTFAALYLLQCLKVHYPNARGSSGHRLFISAFMIASKVICDGTYSNKSWSIVGQGIFPLRIINNMEREMCSRLQWQLKIDPSALEEFEQQVRRDFKGLGPYLTYVLPSPGPLSSACLQQQPSTSPPKPIPPPVPVYCVGARPYSASSSPSTSDTADTPESSMSTSTSPASSAPPSTPLGYEAHSVRVVGSGGTNGMPIHINQASPTTAAPMPSSIPSAATSSYAHQRVPAVLKKVKCGDIFARASPCVW